MGSKKKFSEMSTAQRLVVVVVFAVSLVIVVSAQRDLQHRPDDEVRGSKTLWRLVCLNALGAVGYLRWGRQSRAD